MNTLVSQYYVVPRTNGAQMWSLSVAETPDGLYLMTKSNDEEGKSVSYEHIAYHDATYDMMCTHNTWVANGAIHVGSVEEELIGVEEEL
jgi:hypothetical protein